MRVLLIAEACNPEWTSVPLLAYHWYRAISEHVDVTLVTQIRNQPAFQRQERGGRRVVFIDSEPVARPCDHLGRMLTLGRPGGGAIVAAARWPGYLFFEHIVWNRFRRQLLRGDFDLVHRLTPLSPTYSSPLARWCSVPFVLGPLNGSLPWARGTETIRSREREWLTPLRSLHRLLPYWRHTFERARLVIAAAPHVKRELPPRVRRRTVLLAENGVDTRRFTPHAVGAESEEANFVILFVGRLIPLKQPALILDAVVRARLPKTKLRIVYVGTGPEEERLRSKAAQLGLENQVDLEGTVPHDQIERYYRDASVLVLPSVHESGGAVLLEGMACALPCIVVDYGGPAGYVSDSVGIKVPLAGYEEMVDGFGQAISRLFHDRAHLVEYARNARVLAETKYSWEAKAKELAGLYQLALDDSVTQPAA